MGGGDGGGRSSLGKLDALRQKVREELERSRAAGRRNVFLSFAVEDLDNVNLLRGQAANERSQIEFNDWSVREPYNSERAEYIKQRISERIAQCSVTVVFLSEAAARSPWVDWEIRRSIELQKRVIGVHAGDSPPQTLPDTFRREGLLIVPWGRLAENL